VRKHVRLAARDLAQHELRFQKLRATQAAPDDSKNSKAPSRAR
jgi:hypothetical protein